MKRARRKVNQNGKADAAMFDVIGLRLRGKRFTIWCCQLCTRAWRFAEPVESWRVKNLIKHQQGHTEDRETARLLAAVEPHAKRGDIAV